MAPLVPEPRAFGRMNERDGAGVARILAQSMLHFQDHSGGRLGRTALSNDLLRIMLGRRDKILQRFVLAYSSLVDPTVAHEIHQRRRLGERANHAT